MNTVLLERRTDDERLASVAIVDGPRLLEVPGPDATVDGPEFALGEHAAPEARDAIIAGGTGDGGRVGSRFVLARGVSTGRDERRTRTTPNP
ncbi:hypothetical protein [Halopiger aswanensis]|uniref:Uncharacterized protein n=1 Tax=Halopiger aswanensis TaxID=148449 RepID=A0A419WJ15_9EURY|nr:hypothetical protein [Halopiger aswanensis]RKD95427.1 hypothetical protein ATJ93_2281 [Halopiger aswanensis]